MNKFKEFICRLFHIKTYEKLVLEYSKKFDQFKENENIMKDVISSYQKELNDAYDEISRLKEICKEPLAKFDEAVNEISAQYELCANECEELVNKQDRLVNKAFAEGRAAAYSEMGIWRLDAIEHGNRLVMDKNGEVFELLELEDIECTDDIDPERVSEKDMNGEIELDDII